MISTLMKNGVLAKSTRSLFQRYYSNSSKYYYNETTPPPATLLSQIILGTSLVAAKSLYDMTFCFYNRKVLSDENLGNNFWDKYGKDYTEKAISNNSYVKEHYKVDLNSKSSPTKYKIEDAKWNTFVFSLSPFKCRLFEYNYTGIFEKKLPNGELIRMKAVIDDGKWIIKDATIENNVECSRL